MNGDQGYAMLFGIGLGLLAFLFWMLFPIGDRKRAAEKKEKPKGICPLCKQTLYAGERIRSDQLEIGDVEVQTRIKGCPYCMGPTQRRARNCPVCKTKVEKDEVILAISDPRVDRLKLSIKGCKACWPQGF